MRKSTKTKKINYDYVDEDTPVRPIKKHYDNRDYVRLKPPETKKSKRDRRIDRALKRADMESLLDLEDSDD